MSIPAETAPVRPAARPADRLRPMVQDGAYRSPWSRRQRVGFLLWQVAWATLYRPTPKPLYPWRVWLLKRFGATVSGRPFVAASSRVRIPWLLTLEDRACLGEHAEVYNLGPVRLGPRVTVAQHAYLCAGTHDLSTPALPLVVGPVDVGADAFLGARCFILPGVVIGEGAVVGATATVTKDVEPWAIVAGNPARVVGRREFTTEARRHGDRNKT